MAILSTSSPSGAAIRSGRKTIAYVKADKAVKQGDRKVPNPTRT